MSPETQYQVLVSETCFARQIKQCKGGCCGKEAIGAHSARLMAALSKLRIKPWPYKGPVGIVEKNEFLGREDIHLVDAWRYLAPPKAKPTSTCCYNPPSARPSTSIPTSC